MSPSTESSGPVLSPPSGRSWHSPWRGLRTQSRSPSEDRYPAGPWSGPGVRGTPPAPCPHMSHGRRSYTLVARQTNQLWLVWPEMSSTICWFLSLPSQVHPWRMSPTMSDVQRLHLVGVLNVFTTNWCALDCRGGINHHLFTKHFGCWLQISQRSLKNKPLARSVRYFRTLLNAW